VLEQLAVAYRAGGGRPHRAWLAEAQACNRSFRTIWWESPASPQPPMNGRHLVDALRPELDRAITLLVDGGNIGQWMHQVLADRYPPDWLTCGSSAVVGWGIPGAMAAKLAFPERPAVLLSGDGALHFGLPDLESAVRHRLPFTVVVADDRAWGIVASEQVKAYGPEGLIASAIGPVEYDRVAQGLGARGLRARTVDELRAALREALAADRPTLIHAPIAHGGPTD
jgi:acetolactate synthase-1/2/3 large subunit